MKGQRKNVHNMIPIDICVYAKPNNSCFQNDSHAMRSKHSLGVSKREGVGRGKSNGNQIGIFNDKSLL